MLHSLDDENFASYMVFPISYASNCLMMQLASSYVYSIMACTAYFTCAIGLLITFFCVYDSFHKAENTTTWVRDPFWYNTGANLWHCNRPFELVPTMDIVYRSFLHAVSHQCIRLS